MKKLLLVCTVAAFLAACNGNSKTEATSDSTTVTTSTDTTAAPAATATDTTKIDTTHKMSADTTKK